MADAQIRVIRKTKCGGRIVFIRNEFGTGLVNADAVNVVGNTQSIKQRQIQRKQRLTDMEARKTLLLQNNDLLVFCASNAAIVEPAGPPPTTSTSHSRFFAIVAAN